MSTELVKLRRVATILSGVGFPHEYQGRAAGDIPFLKVSDLSSPENRQGVSSAKNWISRTDARRLGARMAPSGSVIFPKVGAALLGNLRQILLRPAALDNNLMVASVRYGEPRFLLYALRSVDLAELSGSGPLPYVNEGQIGQLRLPWPPVEEQRRIADFLDSETGRVERLQAACLTTRELALERRRSNVYALVTGARESVKRRSGLSWADLIPASWEAVKINHVARMGSGHTPSRSNPEWWEECAIPWVTTGEVAQVRDDRQEVITVTRESLSRLGIANSSAEIHPAGTVVLSRTASAGFSAVMGRDMSTSQDFATWTCGPLLDPYYLLWCLRAMRSDLLGRLAFGSTHKTIYVPDLQSLRIPLPPLDEQRRIVERIRESNQRIDRLVDKIDTQLKLLAERKQSVIAAAVTGRIDATIARVVT